VGRGDLCFPHVVLGRSAGIDRKTSMKESAMGSQLTAIERVAGLDIFNVSPEGLTRRWRDPAKCGDGDAVDNGAPATHRGLFDRMDQWFWEQQQRSMEARLAKAHDRFELERMIRDMDREQGASAW
jgi:hypothetical protein